MLKDGWEGNHRAFFELSVVIFVQPNLKITPLKLIVQQANHRDLAVFWLPTQGERVGVPRVMVAGAVLGKLDSLCACDVVIPLTGFVGVN